MKKGIEHDIHPDVATQTGKKVDQDGIPQLDQFLQNLAAQAPVVQDSFIKQIKTTLETADKFKSGLRDTIEQMQDGYSSVMNMYEMSFYLGIILIVSSLFLAILKGESLLPIVFGVLGIADVIAFFIVEPPQKLQDSRANLAQLQAAYFGIVIFYNMI